MENRTLLKKTVTLSKNNIDALKNEADRLGIRTSDLLRRIIDEKFDKKIES